MYDEKIYALDDTDAIAKIRELVAATTEVVKAVNSGTGKVSKRRAKRERDAAIDLFESLTTNHPTDEQIAAMVIL